ncbi:MAG: Gfo/Idh/MocA family oxidoreductase [Pleurocapsa minor GSE-CHR-MK-17-07R]|jgi:predicted dehydrogenase|nr:Gfo/Idh/MocA family oxidoreductase [Pleurocapsa minor GSE-CHR-MK 17-07R]
MTSLTAAVVGTGFIGPVHAEALKRAGVTVRGMLGISPEKSRAASDALNLEVAYASFDELLADPQVDAVHITTPNKDHMSMTKRALDAGKHVICEKPLAMTSTETAEMVAHARRYPNLVTAVNYNIRFYPLMHHARDMVRAGEIGEVYAIRGGYIQDWLLYETDWNWRLVQSEGGELRAIGDIGTHWMDLMAFVSGLKVESLLADLATFVPKRRKPRQAVATFKGKEQSGPAEYDLVDIKTDDWGSVLFKYQGGARGSMNVSQVSAGRKNFLNFEISGSKGSIAWNSENPNELWLGHRDKPNSILIKDPSLMSESGRRFASQPGGHAEGFPDTFKQLYRAVYGYIEAGDYSAPRPFPTFEEGHDELVLCEAISRSNAEQAWVTIQETTI